MLSLRIEIPPSLAFVFVGQVPLSSETLIPNTIELHARPCKPHKHLDGSTDTQE